MCGICGMSSFTEEISSQQETLEKMMQTIRHRGPDEAGCYLDAHAGLGSLRLSIIDLAGGRQPISNENDTLWIVFNGEIYNYRELRSYLSKRGHEFRTHTDTEVILHLYEEFGAECLQHLNGIFAFAIWDTVRQELILARDRMGIKPLYYTQSAGQLVFGSEMKALLCHPAVKRDIDLISLNEYLSFEYVPSPRTILRGIYRLPAGHVLRYNQQGVETWPYWRLSLARGEMRPPVHWNDYASNLYDVLKSSVQKELVSDVPVGVLLSGGIDSSTVAAMMVDLYPGTVQSFTIGFEEHSFDETPYSRRVAQHLGTEHHELVLTSKMAVELVPQIASILDEPFGDSSVIPTYLLSKFAQEKVKVVLGGDGGDELLAGYPTLMAHRLIEVYERIIPWSIRARWMPWMLKSLPVSFENISFDFRLRRFLAGRGMPLQARHHRWLGSFLDEEKALLLQDWIQPVLRDTYAQAYQYARECDAQIPLNKILYDDAKMYLEGDILFKVDRASMATSLEVRVPLLNRDVVDFASELPLDLKLHGLTGKYLLKRCMRDRLPKDILYRRKKGFNMPVAHWLTGDLRQLLLDMLSEETLRQQGIFNQAYITTLLDDHFAHKRDNRKLLWTLLMFQMWYKSYMAA